MDNNIANVLTGFLRALKIPVTRTTVMEKVNRHPDSPSIATISDLFDKWKMPNGAYHLNFEDLSRVPISFIAHLNSNNGEFALITGVEHGYVIASNEKWKNHKLNIDNFKQKFSCTALLAEGYEKSGRLDYKTRQLIEQLNALRLLALVVSIASLLTFSFYESILSVTIITLFILKTIGFLTSVLLLIQHIDAGNPWLKKICDSGEKIDCNNILASKHSKLFGIISWAELGFFYFSSTLLFLVFNAQNLVFLSHLAI